MFEKVLIIGASRGLGRATAIYAGTHLQGIKSLEVSSRKEAELENTLKTARTSDMTNGREALHPEVRTRAHVYDMARADHRHALGELIQREKYDLVVYATGGGPHGDFATKDWKDHDWALQVGLSAPMELTHFWLKARDQQKSGLFVIVGSRIAESAPDPQATSYAASKHGLLGFVGSLQKELEKNRNKVWLFSPGYMDSEMLPMTAKVRHDGSKLMSVDTAAQALLRWVKNPESQWHRVLN